MTEANESLIAAEAECAAGRTAPRVSLDDIEANIAETHYLLGIQAVNAAGQGFSEFQNLDTLTICLVVTQAGFVIVGKSAPASPENFDQLLGRKLAYEDAVRQLWPLMGYALRERLHNGE
jgi:hypothetical protein